MKKDLKAVSGIFPMPVLMIGTYNEDGTIKLDEIGIISYDPYGHGYYVVGNKVGQAFSDGKKLM